MNKRKRVAWEKHRVKRKKLEAKQKAAKPAPSGAAARSS
jgi:hypothetical protein